MALGGGGSRKRKKARRAASGISMYERSFRRVIANAPVEGEGVSKAKNFIDKVKKARGALGEGRCSEANRAISSAQDAARKLGKKKARSTAQKVMSRLEASYVTKCEVDDD